MAATTPAGAVPPPFEWWERARVRYARWRRAHPRAVRVAGVVRLVVSALVCCALLVALLVVPEIRGGARVWLWCYWLLIGWFLLARTKTLTWRLYGGLFTVAVVWSVTVGLCAWWLSTAVGGPEGVAVSVGMAPVLEESAKLVPLAVLAVLAPGRVRRFAVTDWLLVGYCLGLGSSWSKRSCGAPFGASRSAIRT